MPNHKSYKINYFSQQIVFVSVCTIAVFKEQPEYRKAFADSVPIDKLMRKVGIN